MPSRVNACGANGLLVKTVFGDCFAILQVDVAGHGGCVARVSEDGGRELPRNGD